MTTGDPRIRVDATLSFEVDPKARVFDAVREEVTDAVVERYGHLIVVDDIRSVFRTNHVTLDPSVWHVNGVVEDGGVEVGLTFDVDANGEASHEVTSYVDGEVEDRFAFDPERVKYTTIRLCPGAWFVDAAVEGV